MAHEVRIRETQAFAKVRSPVWVIVWSFFTLGIYGMYWWYQVNRELRDLGRARGSHELGDSPGLSLLAVTLGWLVIVPPFVSIYKGVQRTQAAQRLAGIPEARIMNGWLMLGLLVTSAVVYIPFGVGYFQSELNKVWTEAAIADQPPEIVAAQASVPTQSPPLPDSPPTEQPVLSPAHDPGTPVASTAETARLDQLERLASLRDSGALTADEYEAQKTRILDEL